LATRIVPTLAAIRGWHFWWPHEMHSRTASHKNELLGEGAVGEGATSPPAEESAAP